MSGCQDVRRSGEMSGRNPAPLYSRSIAFNATSSAEIKKIKLKKKKKITRVVIRVGFRVTNKVPSAVS
jgi:hypothetical protein